MASCQQTLSKFSASCRATESVLDAVAARRQTEDAYYTVGAADDERRD